MLPCELALLNPMNFELPRARPTDSVRRSHCMPCSVSRRNYTAAPSKTEHIGFSFCHLTWLGMTFTQAAPLANLGTSPSAKAIRSRVRYAFSDICHQSECSEDISISPPVFVFEWSTVFPSFSLLLFSSSSFQSACFQLQVLQTHT